MIYIYKICIGIVVSFYLFPIGFSFLPESVNTKMILAILGGISFYFDNPNINDIKLNLRLLTSIVISIIFSLICFISVDINNTVDYSYVTYFSSFFVWLSSSYFVAKCIQFYYKTVSFNVLVYYLLAVCFSQCILALIIDNVPAFADLVNTYVNQGEEFLENVDRLYGIGASLDPAGVRFSIVLVLTSALISHDTKTRANSNLLTTIIISFFVVSLVGNMISRTTIIGTIGGVLYFIVFSGLFRFKILIDSLRLGIIFAVILILVLAISVYLYTVNKDFYENIRFAFEGFFNWAEYGEWRTDSTDKLNEHMWVWPNDTKTWIIGSGLFGNYIYSTDIGYCRFILYTGLIGFSVFAFLFVYNSYSFALSFPLYKNMFILLGVISFIVWLKVATDIFFIFALFYSVDSFYDIENTD